MSNISLCLVHLGVHPYPNYLLNTIYQTYIFHQKTYVDNDNNDQDTLNIYILAEKVNLDNIKKQVDQFNLKSSSQIKIIYIDVAKLTKSQEHVRYVHYMNRLVNLNFRNGFWKYTTERFFILEECMKQYNISKMFHIENDIAMFCNLNDIYKSFIQKNNYEDKLVVCEISPTMVIPSILYIDNHHLLTIFNNFITDISKQKFYNDMQLLGLYPNKYLFPIDPHHRSNIEGIFDGCAIGQYLDGIDPRNCQNPDDNQIGFVNETCIIKFDKYQFQQEKHPKFDVLQYRCYDSKVSRPVYNLHIHSKRLHKFSSILPTLNNIISGEKLQQMCDIVICTHDIYQFHKNIDKFSKYIFVSNLSLIDIYTFNQLLKTVNKQHVRLFIYTHIVESVLDNLISNIENKSLTFDIYVHNSDHHFNNTLLEKVIDNPQLKNVFTQNPTCSMNEKIHILPIGIANSMWPHGNATTIMNVIHDTYMYNKLLDIYININTSTHPFRKTVLNALNNSWLENKIIRKQVDHKTYLESLSKYRFCLAIRGNGVDTHRFWEALYLGVVPVVIEDGSEELNNFYDRLEQIGIPFCRLKNINELFIHKYNHEMYLKYMPEPRIQSYLFLSRYF
jgi:hypothetical protein